MEKIKSKHETFFKFKPLIKKNLKFHSFVYYFQNILIFPYLCVKYTFLVKVRIFLQFSFNLLKTMREGKYTFNSNPFVIRI